MSNVKNPDELFKILKAEALGDAAFNHMLGFIQPGMMEIECTDEIKKIFLKPRCRRAFFSHNIHQRKKYRPDARGTI